MFERKGFRAVGLDPRSGRGSYISRQGRKYRFDLKGSGRYPNEINHIDVMRARGFGKTIPKKRFMFGD
jgi:hypothetical protein